MFKQCNECNNSLPIDTFRKNVRYKDGHSTKCKACEAILYDKSLKGLIRRMYATQRDSSIKRGHPLPTYTKEEFKEWILSNPDFNTLITNWIDSDYNTELKPSADRLDNKLPYTLDNLRLTTWAENKAKSYSDRKEGILLVTHKPVALYDMEDNFIAEFLSIAECARYLKVSSSHVHKMCEGKPVRKKRQDGTYYYTTPRSVKGCVPRYK